MMNALILSDNKDFKATLKEKLTNYYTLISEYEHKEISFLTVDLTEFALIDFKSWKSAKEHIVDFLFDKLKTFLPVIKRHVWGSIIVLLPDSENIFLNIAVSAAEGMLKSIACELAPENVILNVLKIKGFDPEKTAELAKFFSDSRAYLTAQVLRGDLTRLPDKLNIQTVTPLNDIKNHLIYCENGSDIKNVMIAGKIVMKDRKILTVDEKSIIAELKLLHEDFLKSYSRVVPFADKTFEYVNKSYWKCMNANDKFWGLTAPKLEYKHMFEN